MIGIIFVLAVGLFVASFMGKKQDNAFQTDQQVYQLAIQQLQEGNYDVALSEMETLQEHESDSESVHYITALAAVNAGGTEKALVHMQRVLDINPHKVEDSMFMLQYAEMLIGIEALDHAKIVLERCEALAIPENYPEYQEKVAEFQEYVAAQS